MWWQGQGQGQAATRHWGQQTLAGARLQSKLESLERLLESGTGTMFLWDADHGVRVFTQYSEAADAYGDAAFSRLCGNLTVASRAELMGALEALRENGAAFALPVFCTDQRTLACQGSLWARGQRSPSPMSVMPTAKLSPCATR